MHGVEELPMDAAADDFCNGLFDNDRNVTNSDHNSMRLLYNKMLKFTGAPYPPYASALHSTLYAVLPRPRILPEPPASPIFGV